MHDFPDVPDFDDLDTLPDWPADVTQEERDDELACILRDLAVDIERRADTCKTQWPLRDLNGNRVGYVEFFGEDGE